jgi:hypothetical protein
LDYSFAVALSDPPSVLGDRGSEVTTVRHLIEAVGSPVLHVLAAPLGLDHRVRNTVLYDPIDPLPDEPDALLLMSGLRPDEPAAIELVRSAAECGYSAIVVKRRGGDITGLLTEASTRGITVLMAADEVPWRHLDSLLLSVLGSQGVAVASAAGAGGELFALANAIAAVIGGSVAIEDIDRRVLAYSSLPDQRIDELRERGILDRRVPDMERNLAQYRTVLAANGVVQFPEAIDEFARLAIAIKAGTQPLGTIWAIVGLGGIAAEGERVLVDGARLAALHMLRSRNSSELELNVREMGLRGALDGSLTAHEVAFRLGLPSGSDLALVGFAAVSDPGGSTPLITHIGSALARYVAAYRPDAAIATTSRAVYVLLAGGGQDAAIRLANGALTTIRKAFEDKVRSAVAHSSPNPADIPAMRREIDGILRATTMQSDLPTVATLVDVHARVLLARVADELAREPRLRHPGVDAMVAFDFEHQTEYAVSITAWMDAIGDVTAASKQLGIHSNTLRYRLRRVNELFSISLDNPDDRLSLWLQLRLAAH